MKRSWCALLILAAACATQPSKKEARILPFAPETSAFHVSDLSGEPETRRYRIKPEEVLGGFTDLHLELVDPGDGSAGPSGVVDPAPALGPVAEAIRSFVAPESWDQDPHRAIYVEGEELVVRHSPKALERVEAFIETMKARRDVLISLSARFVSLPAGDLSVLEHLYRTRGGLAGVFDSKALQEIPQIWSRDHMTVAPKLTVFHAQAGCIRIASNYAYIEGYEKDGPVYDPIPDVLWSGVELKARGVANGPASDRFLLNVEITCREIPNLPAVPSVKLGDRVHEMPVAIENTVRGAFVLGPDRTLVILARPLDPKPARLGLVLVEAEMISQ